MTTQYSPREAMKTARKLGWTVEPKKRTGDILFTSTSGDKFTCRAPGRDTAVPLKLSKALDQARDDAAG